MSQLPLLLPCTRFTSCLPAPAHPPASLPQILLMLPCPSSLSPAALPPAHPLLLHALPPPPQCLKFPAFYTPSPVTQLLARFAPLLSTGTYLIYSIYCLLSHITCLLSHISCHPSPVNHPCVLVPITCVLSLITHILSFILVSYLLSPVSCLLSYVSSVYYLLTLVFYHSISHILSHISHLLSHKTVSTDFTLS